MNRFMNTYVIVNVKLGGRRDAGYEEGVLLKNTAGESGVGWTKAGGSTVHSGVDEITRTDKNFG